MMKTYFKQLAYLDHVASGHARIDQLRGCVILSLTRDHSVYDPDALRLALLNANHCPIVYSGGAFEVFHSGYDSYDMAIRHVEAHLQTEERLHE